MIKPSRLLLLIFVFILPFSLKADDLSKLKFNKAVIDGAGMFSSSEKAQITSVIKSLHRQGGNQMGVVTLNTLGGDSIESVGIQIAEKWKLGSDKKDNGIIFVLSKGERKFRIEVGNGIEGELTDLYAKRVIDAATPYFKEGKFGEGMLRSILLVTQKATPKIDINNAVSSSQHQGSRGQHKKKSTSPLGWIIKILIFLFMVGTPFGRTLLMMSLLSGGRGGGGFGGGGGGFSGGGGGFSGGGASGGW